jgi:hypothetical protein
MKKGTVLNADISAVISRLGHTDTLVVCETFRYNNYYQCVSRKPSPEERNVIAIETFRETATGPRETFRWRSHFSLLVMVFCSHIDNNYCSETFR